MLDTTVKYELNASTVRSLMSTDLLTIYPDDSLKVVEGLFAEEAVRHLPVVDENGKLLGLVTQRDFLTVAVSKLAHVGRDELDTIYRGVLVSDIMGRKITTVTPDTPLSEAALIMATRKYGCLPVVEHDRLVGILTESDFVRAFIVN